MKTKAFGLFAGLIVSAVTGYSAATITAGQIGALRNKDGQVIPVGSVGVLVADFSNNGLLNAAGTTLSVGSFIGGGSDDQILGVFSAVDISAGNIGFDFSGTVLTYTGSGTSFGSGDHLYFVWFPTISTVNGVVGGGVQYGAFRSDTQDEFADIAWVAPADSTNSALYAYNASLGGSPAFSNSQFSATLTTTASAVPEPSSFAAIAGLGVLGVVASRRRRSA